MIQKHQYEETPKIVSGWHILEFWESPSKDDDGIMTRDGQEVYHIQYAPSKKWYSDATSTVLTTPSGQNIGKIHLPDHMLKKSNAPIEMIMPDGSTYKTQLEQRGVFSGIHSRYEFQFPPEFGTSEAKYFWTRDKDRLPQHVKKANEGRVLVDPSGAVIAHVLPAKSDKFRTGRIELARGVQGALEIVVLLSMFAVLARKAREKEDEKWFG